jgi:hypothetical protein
MIYMAQPTQRINQKDISYEDAWDAIVEHYRANYPEVHHVESA